MGNFGDATLKNKVFLQHNSLCKNSIYNNVLYMLPLLVLTFSSVFPSYINFYYLKPFRSIQTCISYLIIIIWIVHAPQNITSSSLAQFVSFHQTNLLTLSLFSLPAIILLYKCIHTHRRSERGCHSFVSAPKCWYDFKPCNNTQHITHTLQ